MVAGEAGLPVGEHGVWFAAKEAGAGNGGDNMKTAVQRRLALLAGLLIPSSLVFATGIQAATPSAPLDGWVTAANTDARNQGVLGAVPAPASGAQPASSDASSTTAWIAFGSAAAVLLVGFAAWALLRRRRQPGELASAAYCAQHPEDPLCSAI